LKKSQGEGSFSLKGRKRSSPGELGRTCGKEVTLSYKKRKSSLGREREKGGTLSSHENPGKKSGRKYKGEGGVEKTRLRGGKYP